MILTKITSSFKRIKAFLNDKDKKTYAKILNEVLTLWIIKKEFPKHYFGRFFYRNNNFLDPKKFMSMKEYYRIIESKNLKSPESDSILHNKLSFDIFSKTYQIPTPRVISHNFGLDFFYENKLRTITNEKELEVYFNYVFEAKNIDGLFLKLIQGYQGIGALLIKKSTLKDNISSIWNSLKNNSYIHQEIIIQHKEINKIFSSTANTIRLETYFDTNRKVNFLGCFMRFGSGKAIIDNASAGGIFVPVDIDTGILFNEALTSMKGGSKTYTHHPDSGVAFKNFKIPFFDELKKEVENATRLLPSRIIGWDIAITPTGPILIEGNYIPALLYGEYSYGGFLNKSIFKEIMLESRN